MNSVTALELVNRVRRKGRFNDTAAFTDSQSKVILNLLNEAIDAVLHERTWSFDRRTDGVLTLLASKSGSTLFVNNGTTFFTLTGYGSSRVANGDFVLRMMVTGDATFGNVAFPCESATNSSGILTGNFRAAFPGTSAASLDYTSMVWEYLLPDTVRKVDAVASEERILDLYQATPGLDTEQMLPNFATNLGDPYVAIIGGTEVGTFDYSSGSAGARKLLIRVYPVPSSDGQLTYQYWYRHPQLSATTDVLAAVPPEIIGLVVDLAFADYNLCGAGNDPTLGAALKADVMSRIRRRYAEDDPGAGARMALRTWTPYRRGPFNPILPVTGL